AACGKGDLAADKDIFNEEPSSVVVKPGQIDEASGIADSKRNPGYLWVQEDGDNPEEISLLSHAGELKKRLKLEGIINRDWEDIALAKGPEPGINYIYLADIGNNNLSASRFYIYRFPEPDDAENRVKSF